MTPPVEPLDETPDFFDVSLDLLCQLRFDGFFARLNPAWERTLGWTRDELMSRPFLEFVHPDDRARTREQNRRVRELGEQAVGFENRYLTKDGGFRWLHWTATPVKHAGLIFSVARDVTERREFDLERERLVAALSEALLEVKTLQQILPICSYCRKIRDDRDYWVTVEHYIETHTASQFSHGICPSCMATVVDPALRDPESPPPPRSP